MLKNKYLNIYLLICWNQNQQKNIDFENDQQIQQINICWKSENFVHIRKKQQKIAKNTKASTKIQIVGYQFNKFVINFNFSRGSILIFNKFLFLLKFLLILLIKKCLFVEFVDFQQMFICWFVFVEFVYLLKFVEKSTKIKNQQAILKLDQQK